LSLWAEKKFILHPNDMSRETGYDYTHHRGILQMRRQLGIGDGQIIRRLTIFDEDRGEVENAIPGCIAKGADIILALSRAYGETGKKLAGQFPQLVFSQGRGAGSEEMLKDTRWCYRNVVEL
jgi:hypothetical protein